MGDIGSHYTANGVVGLAFSASGPEAVTLTVGSLGGLTKSQLASGVFAIFLSADAAIIVMSLIYRQPGRLRLVHSRYRPAEATPDAHLHFPELIGAFFLPEC